MAPQEKSAAPTRVPLVTAVIVNFNGGEMICKCLAALALQSFADFVTVVVDNNSSDGSVARIREHFPEVILLSLDANLGFAGGVNHVLRHYPLGEWIALLNPDAFPAADWLAQLVSTARSHPEFASFGSRMFSDEAHHYLDGVGDAYHVSGLPWRIAHGCADSPRYNQNMEIFAPCAAASMYRVEALARVGFLDEDFFCYIEDVDLGFRLQLAGFRSLYVHTAAVQHVGSGLVGDHSDFQLYHGHRNLVWAYIKSMPGILFWVFLPFHLLLNLFTLCWFLLRGNGAVVLRAKRDAVRGIAHFWKKRREIQAGRKASLWHILRRLSWNPFSRFP